jgi:hypothetical protein
MSPRPGIVSGVLPRAVAQCSQAAQGGMTGPQGPGRTSPAGRRRPPARGVLHCAARSVRGATQFRPIGSWADQMPDASENDD